MSAVGRRERTALVVIVGLALALRLGLALLGSGDERFTFVDSASYRIFAAELPDSLGDPDDREVRDVSLQRSPGYPVVVRLLGGASGAYGPLVSFQCVLGGLVTVLLVHRLGREVAGPEVGLAAAAVVAVDPVSVGHCLLVGTETVVAALVAGAALAAWRARAAAHDGRSALPAAAAVGVAVGAAALVRPQLTYLLPLVALGAAALLPVGRRWRPRAAAGVVVLVVAALLALPWVVRTSVVAGRPMVSSAQGQNLADFGAAAMEAEASGVAWWPEPTAASYARQDRARERFDARYGTGAGDPDPARLAARWEEAGWDALAAHPRGALAVAGSSLVRGVVGPGDTLLVTVAGPDPPPGFAPAVRALAVVALGIELAGAAAGLVVLARRRRWAALGLLALPVAVYLVSSSGPQMYARFRVPVVPLVAVLAAVGVVAVLRRVALRRPGRS